MGLPPLAGAGRFGEGEVVAEAAVRFLTEELPT
jgi:hypothetical protein